MSIFFYFIDKVILKVLDRKNECGILNIKTERIVEGRCTPSAHSFRQA